MNSMEICGPKRYLTANNIRVVEKEKTNAGRQYKHLTANTSIPSPNSAFKKIEAPSNKRANPYAGDDVSEKKAKAPIDAILLEGPFDAIIEVESPIKIIVTDEDPTIEHRCYTKNGIKRTYNLINGKLDGLVRIEDGKRVITACFREGVQMTPDRHFLKAEK